MMLLLLLRYYAPRIYGTVIANTNLVLRFRAVVYEPVGPYVG
jgi:hypothetical protein